MSCFYGHSVGLLLNTIMASVIVIIVLSNVHCPCQKNKDIFNAKRGALYSR